VFSLGLVAVSALARRLPARPELGRALNLGGAGLFAFLAVRLSLARPQ
jgi:threonine/homoserine/homoserine lactone efflux protein